MLALADLQPSDMLYDMGCGDANLLIYAVKVFGVKKAVGFENMPQRMGLARRNIAKHNLSSRIVIKPDMYKADLSKADVILDTMPEGETDFDDLYSNTSIRDGTRLIKHDLPLLGFVPTMVDCPFYQMTYPLKKAKTRQEWAECVMECKDVSPKDVWHDLYHYSYERAYGKRQLETFDKVLSRRLA
jgi:hypothetical protein